MSYTLAERMMAKAHEENRLEEVEHMRLYLLILLDQKKHKEALALLDGPLGQKSLRDPEVRQIRMELLLANEKWEQVLESAEQALRTENADDWISWQAYFDAVQALLPNDSSLADKAYTLVADLKKAALEASVLKRGPFLAELELDFRLGKAAQGSGMHIEESRKRLLFIDTILNWPLQFRAKYGARKNRRLLSTFWIEIMLF